MSNMSEDIQYAGSDTRPPMLDRTEFKSWQQRIRLYCLGKDNGENIMKSITEGPFQMRTMRDTLSKGGKGALHLGIPKDIYTLINYFTDAKDIWDNVKMILEGSEFTKLINDMRNIKMAMSIMQLNSKFVNNMLLEWSRFITEVKLNRGLKESNFDQLYAYLKQHEVHANENRMMMEMFIQPTNDPLALVSNASVQQYPTQSSMSAQSSNEPNPAPADNFQLHSDVQGRYNAHNQGRPFQRNNARGNVVAGNAGGQNRDGNVNLGQAKPIMCYKCKGIRYIARECPQPKRPRDSNYFKDKILLMNAYENGVVLDEEQLLFLAGEQVTNFDDDMDDLALNVDHVFEADQCDAFDSDVDEAPTTQSMFMVNLSSEDPIYDEAGPSYDSNTLFEVQDHDTFIDHMDEYHEVHEMQSDVQHNSVVDFDADYTSDSNIIPYDQYVEDNEEHVVQSNVSSVQNDALMSILDEMHEQGVQSRLANKPDMIINDSVTSELARYKELVGEYEKWAKSKTAELLFRCSSRYNANNQGRPFQRNNARGNVVAGNAGGQNRGGNVNPGQAKPIMCYNCKGSGHIALKWFHNQSVLDDFRLLSKTRMLLMNAHDNVMWTDNEEHVVQSNVTSVRNDAVDVNSSMKCTMNREYKVGPANKSSNGPLKEVKVMEEIFDQMKTSGPEYCRQANELEIELLEYVIGTCPKSFNERDNKAPSTPVTRKKQVTFNDKPGTSSSNTQKHEVHQKVQQTNVPVIHSTGVNTSTEASGSKPRSNTKKNRILPAKTENKKKVEDHPRTNKSVWTKVNRVDSSISSKRVVINSNSESVCKTCNKCLNSASHEMCVVNILNSVNSTPTVKIVLNKGKQIWKPKGKLSDNSLNKTKQIWKPKGKLSDNSLNKTKRVWKATGKLFTNVGYQWRPTGKKFALGELCPLTRLPVTCGTDHLMVIGLRLFKTYDGEEKVHQDGNNHVGAIMGYGDYMIGDSVVSRAYYVEGLGHNLFSVGQFCDSDLEVAFRKHLCFVRNIDGVDLLKDEEYDPRISQTPSRRRAFQISTPIAWDEEALTASADVPSSVTETTDTTSTLPPPPPPLQKPTGLAPTDKELEMLFQPMFDEYFEQSRVNEPVPSTTAVNTKVVPPEEPTLKDSLITHDALHPSFNPVTGEPGSAQSSSGNVNSVEPNPPDHLKRWTKDHPLDNIVGNPCRPVSTRKQLASDALWCCFHTELSKVEHKNFKMVVIEDCWFQAMQMKFTNLIDLKYGN
ncbi:hypothetical protein Tco_0228773 [Tanacetum coccineum]